MIDTKTMADAVRKAMKENGVDDAVITITQGDTARVTGYGVRKDGAKVSMKLEVTP